MCDPHRPAQHPPPPTQAFSAWYDPFGLMERASRAAQAAVFVYWGLAFTRYCFTMRLVCTNQCYSLQTPPLSGHPTSLLHRTHYCAIYVSHRPPCIAISAIQYREWQYCVNANSQAFSAWYDPFGLMERASRAAQAAVFVYWGRGCLPLPRRTPITMLFGRPIFVEAVPDPTAAQVSR